MPKVSIIVPVYGVETYIEKAARSLFEQTLDDLEFIFVNDCTKDSSISILKEVVSEYPNRSGQLKIIEMSENSGQAKVREIGIENATGQYITHCDSDDWVELDMYERLWTAAVATDSDIVICDYFAEYEGNSRDRLRGKDSKFGYREGLCLGTTPGFLWNKLVRREIVQRKEILFPQNNMCEDVSLSIQYALLAERIEYIQAPLYHYSIRVGSLTSKKDPISQVHKANDYYENLKLAIEQMKNRGQYKKLRPYIVRQCLSVKNTLLGAIPFISCRSTYVMFFREYTLWILFSKYVTMKEKLMFLIVTFGLYPLYYKGAMKI